MYSTTARDQDGDGLLDPSGQHASFELFDTLDYQTLHALSQLFLKFNWR